MSNDRSPESRNSGTSSATAKLQAFIAECISDGFSLGPFSGVSGREFWKCPHCGMGDYDGHEQSCVIRVMAERIVELSIDAIASETGTKISEAAARYQWLKDASGRTWDELAGAHLTGQLDKAIDNLAARDERPGVCICNDHDNPRPCPVHKENPS